MTREEAIKKIREIYHTDEELEALRTLIPELAESEDERIRKELVAFFKEMRDTWHEIYWHDLQVEGILAWLEKQKEEEGYEAIPVESTLEYKLGFKAGKESEKQKEPNYDTYKNEREMWVESVISNTFPKQDGDFISEEDYRKILRKTADNFYEMGKKHKETLHIPETCKENPDSFTHVPENGETGTQEQKPVEWNEPKINGNPIFTENKVVDISPTEWGEEDERMIQGVIGDLESLKDWIRAYDQGWRNNPAFPLINKRIDWLKSLRPSWKPSEEQIYSLGTVVKGYNECAVGSVGYHLKEMYEQLKKL